MSRLIRTPAGEAILLGGMTAGVLDIADAIVVTAARGGDAIRMLQSIASGVLGAPAYDGGLPTAALGLALHFFIATCAAAAYWLASRRLRVLVDRPVLCGLAFGVAVWAVMQHLVLPLTFGRRAPTQPLPLLLNQIGIHILGVGLPIAYFAARAAARANRLIPRSGLIS